MRALALLVLVTACGGTVETASTDSGVADSAPDAAPQMQKDASEEAEASLEDVDGGTPCVSECTTTSLSQCCNAAGDFSIVVDGGTLDCFANACATGTACTFGNVVGTCR